MKLQVTETLVKHFKRTKNRFIKIYNSNSNSNKTKLKIHLKLFIHSCIIGSVNEWKVFGESKHHFVQF